MSGEDQSVCTGSEFFTHRVVRQRRNHPRKIDYWHEFTPPPCADSRSLAELITSIPADAGVGVGVYPLRYRVTAG